MLQRQKVINRLNHFFDPDNDSDTEVPYADIMITVRGVSTPDLTQVGCLSAAEGKEVREKVVLHSKCLGFYANMIMIT